MVYQVIPTSDNAALNGVLQRLEHDLRHAPRSAVLDTRVGSANRQRRASGTHNPAHERITRVSTTDAHEMTMGTVQTPHVKVATVTDCPPNTPAALSSMGFMPYATSFAFQPEGDLRELPQLGSFALSLLHGKVLIAAVRSRSLTAVVLMPGV